MPFLACRIVGNQEYSLPIASEITEKGYDTSKSVKFMDSKKPLFQVRTRLVSSVYTDDEILQHFFTAIQESQKPGHDDALLKGIEQLKGVNPSALVQFSPVLLDELFRILGQTFSAEDIPRQAFQAISYILQVVSTAVTVPSRRDSSLLAYVHYRFSNHSNSKKLVFEEVTKYWLTLLEEKHPSARQLIKFSWFYFELIIKRSASSSSSPWHLKFPNIFLSFPFLSVSYST